MDVHHLDCGLTILTSKHGGVTSDGARVAICEADGETVIETAASLAMALPRASEIVRERNALPRCPGCSAVPGVKRIGRREYCEFCAVNEPIDPLAGARCGCGAPASTSARDRFETPGDGPMRDWCANCWASRARAHAARRA